MFGVTLHPCARAGLQLASLSLLVACHPGVNYLPLVHGGPSPSPTATASASPSGSPTAQPVPGGVAVIAIPTPAPVLCSPAPVTVPVGQNAVIDCTAAGYNGPFTWTLSDPTVASIQPATGTNTFFYVGGLKAGTTTLLLQFGNGGSGSETITVPSSSI